jgi:hypothetical protein
MEECKSHSGIIAKLNEICRRLDRVDGISDDQWTIIHQKISTKTLLAITTIVLVITLATVGFLWNGQKSLATDIQNVETKILGVVEQNKKEGTEDRKLLSGKVGEIQGDLRELKTLLSKDRVGRKN